MEAKKIFVTQSAMPPLEEYVSEIESIWETHWMTNMGTKYKQLKRELVEYLGVDNLELFVNGHLSLELSLQAMNLQGEVITTPYTFVSTTHAIVRNGLEPVFCDINPIDFTIDVEKIEALITDRTCAIMPVHVYGNICNVEEIDRLAKKYGLKVIYDAAHSFGEKYKGVSTSLLGDVSCFSFHATKVFNTIEGGAVCFRDSGMEEKLINLRNFGIKNEEVVDAVGANAKMNEFCAAMGICNLRHLDNNIQKRKNVADRYRENLRDLPGITLNVIQKDVDSNYAYFPILISPGEAGFSRNELSERLKQYNVFSRKYFYPVTNSMDCFHGKYDVTKTPVALSVSKRVLTLPMYPDLDLSDVDKICNIIKEMM